MTWILTGDLGVVGGDTLKNLMRMHGYLLGDNYQDCGMMIYDPVRHDVHAGMQRRRAVQLRFSPVSS